jgi:ABC-type uncharacterized transport system involved in gliding motility auxiliary subunit
MSKSIKPHLLMKAGGGVAALLILLAGLTALNVLLSNARLRVDLTEEKLYSLSDGTRNILTDLDRNVELKFFFNSSENSVPVMLKNYARQIEDLLREYELASGKKISLSKLDPKPLSDAEDWAKRYGLQGLAVSRTAPPVYLGLVAVSGKQEMAIPVLDPRMQQLLEYNISQLIYQVTHPEKPIIGLISSLPVMGSGPQQFTMPGQPQPPQMPAWIAISELRANYEVRELTTPEQGIPSDLSALLVIHPKALDDATLFAIDQYILGGGHATLLVDPLAFSDQSANGANPYAQPNVSSDLKRLFSAWGVGYDPARVLADIDAGTDLPTQDNRIERNPAVLSYHKKQLNGELPSTSQLDTIQLVFAGALQDNTSAEIDVTPLLTSTPNCGTTDATSARYGAKAIFKKLTKSASPQALGLLLQGTFQTAFPDGKPKAASADGQAPDVPPTAGPEAETLKTGTSAVVIIADVDFINDQICVESVNIPGIGNVGHRRRNDNLSLFINVVEQMGGNDNLIGIRSRGTFNRPFTYVDELERKAIERGRTERERLEAELSQTQRRLDELQAAKSDASQMFVLSDQQRDELENFRKAQFKTEQQLKELEKKLMRDVERLGTKLKALNMGLMPLLVGLIGIGFGIYRKRRR